MMKMALTVWGNLISPVFDTASTLLIVEITDKQVNNRHFESFNPAKLVLLLERLSEQEVSILVCGAISEAPAHLIENSDLELIPFISGNIDKIIDRYLTGLSLKPSFLMPGCACRHNRCKTKRTE